MAIIYTWRGIAKYLNVCYKTLKRWHKKKPLPVLKMGGTYYISVDQIQKWMGVDHAKTKSEDPTVSDDVR